jgi:hypothetical protein
MVERGRPVYLLGLIAQEDLAGLDIRYFVYPPPVNIGRRRLSTSRRPPGRRLSRGLSDVGIPRFPVGPTHPDSGRPPEILARRGRSGPAWANGASDGAGRPVRPGKALIQAARHKIGGLKTVGALARVGLTVTNGTDEFSWDAPVWFCDPWPHPFGLAGLEGFLHYFLVTIRAYDGYLDIEPQS